MKNFKKQFPLLEQYTYLNTAASGLLSENLLEFRQDHDLDFLIGGSLFRDKRDALFLKVRKAVGDLFGCAPNLVALTPNFSFGFNTLLEGIDHSKKVLLLKNDYPSVNWAVESRGFEVCYAEIDENLEDNIAEVVSREKPDIFAFSLVQYINGIKIDPDFLLKLKEDNPGLLLFADGTQFCGTEKFDFEASALDVLGASAYKWLNAGYGNGFFLFKEHMQEKVQSGEFEIKDLQGKNKPHKGSFIGTFEPGHLDTLNFGSLKTAIDLIKQVGIAEIENGIKELASVAKAKLSEKGVLESAVVNRELHSSIFNIRGDDKLFQKLRTNRIICSQRGEGIRLSFHYFNSEEDLENLLKQL
ncbi:aminotransferase class V-fold PLP-dependent enzyme [Salinimicrobium sp. MT39]|uniref:Aminotransferase class V-fold PLP-dependent enzyme n=1 Tax=Salinimicrobium profundisediminis TaxID=2994553 RepID=A0A9X3I1J7_9FLAO|nr:aminotransferase class V-fold PLP-dependent enzyme [Salinimicrobium profundisediminis]MCX2839150.1 aminotransferase class V-fold PLP-dependent enzyme [Salinimicrobium profundisediminis]